MNIIDKIKYHRKRQKLSQKKVAEIAGISQAAYAKIENGTTEKFSIDVAKGIAKALEVSFNELFDIELPEAQADEQLRIENQKLKQQIADLTNVQLKDKTSLIEGLRSNNILYDFAMSLYHASGEYDKARIKSYQEKDDIIERAEYFSKLMPFSRENPESIIDYISKNFKWEPKN